MSQFGIDLGIYQFLVKIQLFHENKTATGVLSNSVISPCLPINRKNI